MAVISNKVGGSKRKVTSPPSAITARTNPKKSNTLSKTDEAQTTADKLTLPPSRVDATQATRAVEALLQHNARHQALVASKKSKQDLLASEAGDYILIQIALAKIPERVSPKPVPLSLPHPLHGSGGDDDEDHAVCLIVKESDKGKVQRALNAMKMDGVREVVGLQELRTDYKEFQERRQLRDAFDLFLVDDRILPLLGKALGKTFFSKKKHPVALKLGGLLSSNPQAMATVGKRIIAAQQRAHLYRNHGNCLSVKVAKTSFRPAEAVANVLAGIEAAVEATPGKWKNVMAISVKTSSSVALPLYQRLPQYLIKKPGALGIGQAVHAQLEGDEPGEEGEEGEGKGALLTVKALENRGKKRGPPVSEAKESSAKKTGHKGSSLAPRTDAAKSSQRGLPLDPKSKLSGGEMKTSVVTKGAIAESGAAKVVGDASGRPNRTGETVAAAKKRARQEDGAAAVALLAARAQTGGKIRGGKAEVESLETGPVPRKGKKVVVAESEGKGKAKKQKKNRI